MSLIPPAGKLTADPRITAGGFSDCTVGDIPAQPRGGSAGDLTLSEIATPLAETVRALRPENVIVEELALHPLLPPLKGVAGRLILDLHNVESDLAAARVRGWRRMLGAAFREGARMRAIERRACGLADAVWVCSSIDVKRLRAVAGRELQPRVVPNGIPNWEKAPRRLAARARREGGPVLLFGGHLRYAPNVDAAKLLVRQILPAVRARLPGAKLVLAGRAPRPSLTELNTADVAVVADPPDMAALLAQADFAVVPLTRGSGTRIKIIEAMAWGVPVVATPKAAEGLDLVDGVNVRFAEEAEEFARAIEALWRDPSLCERLRNEAHRFAFERFGPEAIARAVDAALHPARRDALDVVEPAV
jgi:glycosyltransferase involved in cell wall biosynthesis